MTVRCPSCSANLKVNVDRLGSRASAKCPSCHAAVPLTAQTAAHAESQPASVNAAGQATLVVTCQACKTRLKAPVSRAGTKSTCPKCRASVLIETTPAAVAPNVLVATAGAESQEESSSASTRRIDSRMIGMMSSGRPVDWSAGVDLDAFLKTRASVTSPSHSETPISLPQSDPGSIAPLLKPPVAALEKIAMDIRQTAEHLTRSAESDPAPAATGLPDRARQDSGMAPSAQPVRRPSRAGNEHAEDHATHAAPAHAGDRFFPSWRGIVSGGVAGLLLGAAQAGLAMSAFASMLPPLPFPAGMLELPEVAVRIVLAALLGTLAGFIAGAAGSPRYSDRPLNLMRCGGTALLMGLACGLVGGLVTGSGVQVWPIANWMRDLLLVGLLTPALNRLLPVPSS